MSKLIYIFVFFVVNSRCYGRCYLKKLCTSPHLEANSARLSHVFDKYTRFINLLFSWLVRSTPERTLWARAPAGDILSICYLKICNQLIRWFCSYNLKWNYNTNLKLSLVFELRSRSYCLYYQQLSPIWSGRHDIIKKA